MGVCVTAELLSFKPMSFDEVETRSEGDEESINFDRILEEVEP